MPKLTDEDIHKMSIPEARRYTQLHPEESLRIAQAFAISAVKQSVKAAKYALRNISKT